MAPSKRGGDEPLPGVPWSGAYSPSLQPFFYVSDSPLQEATRAYESLNVLERGVLVLTRAVLGNRRTRTAFIFYAISLHLLTAFTLYECTTSSGSQLQRQPSPYIS